MTNLTLPSAVLGAFVGEVRLTAGITGWQFCFRLFPGSIRGPQVVEFLRHLRRQIPRRLLVIWDRFPAHRSRAVQDYIEAQDGHIVLEYLPAYAPELNPAEYVWGYWKQHEMATSAPRISPSSAPVRGAACDACNAGPRWSRRFGSRRTCSSDVTILTNLNNPL